MNSSSGAKILNTRKSKVFLDSSIPHNIKPKFLFYSDWMVDKKQSTWFIPSVNWFMSKIFEEDWYLTPANTNLNESAHPYTNKHTGTNLKVLEAIQKYGNHTPE